MVYTEFLEKKIGFYLGYMQMVGNHERSVKLNATLEAIPSDTSSLVSSGEGAMCL